MSADVAPGSSLPRQPVLREYLSITRLPGGRLAFRGGGQSVVLSGASAEDVVLPALPYLDGRHSVAEVTASLPQIEPALLVEALEVLDRNHLLEDGAESSATHAADPRFRYQTNAWLSLSDNRYHYQEVLASSRIAVVGLGALGKPLVSLLADAGVGEMRLADGKNVTIEDELHGYRHQSVGTPRVDAAAEQIADLHPGVVLKTLGGDFTKATSLRSLIEGVSFVVVCVDSSLGELTDRLNELSLQLDVRLLRASVSHDRGAVGPTVVPGESACLRCLELRLNSNAAFVDDSLPYRPGVVATTTLSDDLSTASTAIVAPFAQLVAAYAAVEVIKSVTGFVAPATRGAFLGFNLFSGEVRRHEVLKVPRCTSCGPLRTRPQMKIWDIGRVAPDQR